MRRVLIIGCPGSGKTTFAKRLAERTGLPLVHLDRIYWCDRWEHLSRDDFDAALQEELEKPEWIIDGNYNRTLEHRLKYSDMVFFFDMPTAVCLWGITKRVLQNHERTRQDLGKNCEERFGRNFAELFGKVWIFKKNHRKKSYELLKNVEI